MVDQEGGKAGEPLPFPPNAFYTLRYKQVKPRFTTTSRAISFKKLIKNAKKKHFKTINQEINEDNMAKKQKSEPEEPTPLAIAT